ncbi:DUF542 domain-containing protein [Teredinibacter franksiae]|jgi:Regulator of cell morphogenesis and NO signaling|uniref:DUF542 domain-containing protein n=1 Tax=Teredinibacter franksiae TaxID=2761453 RepID=UPI0016246E4F|nr:DUF542 domain-containing protein [Teredinibacter franksiae]
MKLLDLPLKQIACAIPGASKVFYYYQIDLCTMGELSLSEAITANRLNNHEVIAALQKLREPSWENKNWHDAPSSELINYILDRYHLGHRQQLPELIRLAKCLEASHSSNKACPIGITQMLRNLEEDLEQHMINEELDLFPLLTAGDQTQLNSRLSALQFKHGEHDVAINKLLSLTNNLQCPEEACTNWKTLYFELYRFITELKEHIHLEDDILFGQPFKA